MYLWTHRRGHWNAIVCSGKWSSWSLTSGNVMSAWARPWHPSAAGCASSLKEQTITGTVLDETLPRNLRADPTPTRNYEKKVKFALEQATKAQKEVEV